MNRVIIDKILDFLLTGFSLKWKDLLTLKINTLQVFIKNREHITDRREQKPNRYELIQMHRKRSINNEMPSVK